LLAEFAKITADMEKTTDRVAMGNLKVSLKLNELDQTDTKNRITTLTADLLEAETQYKKRQEEQAIQIQIDSLLTKYNNLNTSVNTAWKKIATLNEELDRIPEDDVTRAKERSNVQETINYN
jgi:chromosome segregation ATPase